MMKIKKAVSIFVVLAIVLSCICIMPVVSNAEADTNLENWTVVSGDWTNDADGYKSGGSRALSSCDTVIDGTKSFVYEVTYTYSGYGAGPALGLADENNYLAIEIGEHNRCYFPYRIDNAWNNYNNVTVDFKDLLKAANVYTVRFEYYADKAAARVFVNGYLMEGFENFDVNRIKGKLGLFSEDASANFTSMKYTELTETPSFFDTNLTFTGDFGTWSNTVAGYMQIGGGRGLSKSNIVIDGTKSFIMDTDIVNLGYGIGIAFNIVDTQNYNAVEIGDGNAFFFRRESDVWNLNADMVGLPASMKGTNQYKLTLVYMADTKTLSIYVDGIKVQNIQNVDPARINGAMGLFTEDAKAYFLSANYTEIDADYKGLEGNVTNITSTGSEWVYSPVGYEDTTAGEGRSCAFSDMTIDGTKSFNFKTTFAYNGYGAGIAFNAVDGDNFIGVQVNRDGNGNIYMPRRIDTVWSLWVDGFIDSRMSKSAIDTIEFDYNVTTKVAKIYLNNVLVKTLEDFDATMLAGNIGFFTESAAMTVLSSTLIVQSVPPVPTGDTSVVTVIALLAVAAVCAIVVIIKKEAIN